jgi:hypothetical protein
MFITTNLDDETMADTPSLDTLRDTAERDPANVDYRAVCAYLTSDDYETSKNAEEIRDIAIEAADDPRPIVNALRELQTVEDDNLRRTSVESLYRVVRAWPRTLAPVMAVDLDASDVRRRAAAADVLGRTASGAVRPHAAKLAKRLSDPDDRVAALALSALDGIVDEFPEAVTPYVSSVGPFLDDRWIPTDSGGIRQVYSKFDQDTSSGEPGNEKLTNRAPRPFKTARSLVHSLALTHPTSLDPLLPRLRELATDPSAWSEVGVGTLIDTLTRIARANRNAVEPIVPAVERYVDSSHRRRRLAACNFLDELGQDRRYDELGKDRRQPNPVSVSSMAVRDIPPREDDEDILRGIDQRAIAGELRFDLVPELLRCTDPDVRDTAAWGLECGVVNYVDDVHRRAADFLGLLNEPHECTRKHLLSLLGTVIKAYPEEWTPALRTLSSHDDPLVRAGALRLLASAATVYPALFAGDETLLSERSSDVPAVQAASFAVLRDLAEPYPSLVEQYVPTATDAFSVDKTRLPALRFLATLARTRPTAVAPVADSVMAVVEQFAGPERIAERGQWGKKRGADVSTDDRVLKAALETCLYLAKRDSAAVRRVRPHAERVADGRYYGDGPAIAFLATLDASADG